eukprot:437563-Pelagomonas_calceolata.AAC.11
MFRRLAQLAMRCSKWKVRKYWPSWVRRASLMHGLQLPAYGVYTPMHECNIGVYMYTYTGTTCSTLEVDLRSLYCNFKFGIDFGSKGPPSAPLALKSASLQCAHAEGQDGLWLMWYGVSLTDGQAVPGLGQTAAAHDLACNYR